MNPTIQQLFDRKSTRQFTNQTVTAQDLELILDSAITAPTAGNQVLYSIINITDQTIKDTLAKSCDNQPFIAKAPVVLIFVADCRRWYDIYITAGAAPRTPGVGDILLACQDAMIAAQNAVVAAESLGIGSCYIGDILENAETHRKLLNLDKYVLPIGMLVMGYPTESQLKKQKQTRFNRDYIVFENAYRRLNKDEQKRMFTEVKDENFDFNSYINKFCERKYNSDFSVEMTRSSEVYIKNFMSGE